MPGVVFVVSIPTSNHEHFLRFGRPKTIIDIDDDLSKDNDVNYKLEVELKNKRSPEIPVYVTRAYYNEPYNPHVARNGDFVTMERILEELLDKLRVDKATWYHDKVQNYFQVIFPLPAGDPCETMLHCLTQLGIGTKCKSIVSVIPCTVVHSAEEREEPPEDLLLRKNEESRRWRTFVESIRSKLTVKQVVDGVRGGGELSFDYITLIITADSLAALGLVENNSPNITAAMLVSPLMGPVMSITFGVIISDKELVKTGFLSLFIGMMLSLLFGFIFGLILGTTEMPWGFGDWPTEEMKSRGNARSLWMGVLWALTSGTGVAVALLNGAAGPLIGVAISASLLPPIVNCGLFWALGCIWLLYDGVKIPHIKGEPYYGNSSYVPLYSDYLPIEFAVNGIVSFCLTVINVICIFITAIVLLKIKEVSAPYTSSPELRRFWQQDIRVTRESNKARMRKAEDDERRELLLEDLNNQGKDGMMREKLQEAVKEALDDDTFRRVKRISYQSHMADEVSRTLGLNNETPKSHVSSVTPSTPHSFNKRTTVEDIQTLDKILSTLLDPVKQRASRSYSSHQSSPRGSYLPTIVERRAKSHTDTDRLLNDSRSILQSVMGSIKSQKRKSKSEEPFLTPPNSRDDD